MGRRQFTPIARTEEAEATVKLAQVQTQSAVNATVIEVAAGSGYLKSIQQMMIPYQYGEQNGYVTVTIDGVALNELNLVKMVFTGAYPATYIGGHNVFYNPSIRYEASLLVEHRRVKANGGACKVDTVVTYTEE